MKQIVNAILTIGPNYLLQLRDDNPAITDPGLWGTFGGMVDEGESPDDALPREVMEETCMSVDATGKLGVLSVTDVPAREDREFHIYHSDITHAFRHFQCREGQRGAWWWPDPYDDTRMSGLTRDILYVHQHLLVRATKTVVMCHGVFDILHHGHLVHLTAARKHGNYLIVSLVADRFVEKGPGRPIFDQEKRAAMLAAIKVVDKVIITESPGPMDHIRLCPPHVFVRGNDYRDQAPPEIALLESMGIPVRYTPPNNIHSSELVTNL